MDEFRDRDRQPNRILGAIAIACLETNYSDCFVFSYKIRFSSMAKTFIAIAILCLLFGVGS
ncbi:hypothetical protein [Spirulina sp. 06S082]|uniref:hypothetical protein n=1 Tax=Spirulina sp. 06S082 TaxID=3110248 RepID=UPI002B2022F5|nr:hypothetical protein [Spirulina sp. 06S082]MEA5469876.1 hypothetical protein [Spirulina sp. 06S082]